MRKLRSFIWMFLFPSIAGIMFGIDYYLYGMLCIISGVMSYWLWVESNK